MRTPDRKPVIALVDDDSIFRLIASRTIQGANITERILQFTNGGEALEYLEGNSGQLDLLPDVLFLDINMPYVDGWMFLDDFEKIKSKLGKPISIFMVSSSLDPEDVNRAKQHKLVNDYVVKPVSKETFAKLVGMAA
ncbi:MAG: response regulator [Bacteroidetes bacterium]|nr:response regulator [Bacteroidota bacterium]MBI3483169.1 response regulator [Bacteroidota bacterium]